MKIVIAGLDAETCRQLLPIQPTENSLEWLSPADFMVAAESADSEVTERRWVWLYRAPWTLLLTWSSEKDLMEWQAQQCIALRLRGILGQQLMLVNADQVNVARLGAKLGLIADQPTPFPVANEDERGEKKQPPGLDLALAKLFEWIAPQYWDVFEALEAVAWLPEGNPLFRHDLSPPPQTLLQALGQTIKDSQALTAALERLTLQEETISALQAAVKEGDVGLQAARTTCDQQKKELEQFQEARQTTARQAEEQYKELTQENELLLLQLHQVQEELEKTFLESRERIANMEQDQATQATQQAAKVKQLEGELAKIRQALNESKAAVTQAAEQRKQLEQDRATQATQQAAKVKQLEGELAKIRQALNESKAAVTQAAEQRKQLEQDRATQATQQAAKVKQLEGELAKIRQALNESKTTAAQASEQYKQLEQENELLLLQLHQVQEELESYFLANRELLMTLKSSQALLTRSRMVIGRLALNG